ncbi:MarR family winged helix-turn-helix transcriptional regulator [Marinivivus vitaminiproducens]|uniref:MarR family winged helix-turn-helix transcriptional regulator n=1 Tax=Marinivivus vitaminiproducens TaxID=3035935 RepID=UPI00279B2A8D|nr:MarR family transcriptional regulator [Geminicoccaceae bacterium SCSIO 64248]
MTVAPAELEHFFQTTTLRAPDNAVGFVLWRVAHRYQREAERELAPLNLTHLQFTTLAMTAWLCRSGELPTQAELARDAAIHPMQISLMLKVLEKKGFVGRSRSTVDTRSKQVTITPDGMDALRQAMPVVIALQQRLFGDDGAPGGALLDRLRAVETRGDGAQCMGEGPPGSRPRP